jgi:hypothetical protein
LEAARSVGVDGDDVLMNLFGAKICGDISSLVVEDDFEAAEAFNCMANSLKKTHAAVDVFKNNRWQAWDRHAAGTAASWHTLRESCVFDVMTATRTSDVRVFG